jgi:hypothetical protein
MAEDRLILAHTEQRVSLDAQGADVASAAQGHCYGLDCSVIVARVLLMTAHLEWHDAADMARAIDEHVGRLEVRHAARYAAVSSEQVHVHGFTTPS